MIESKFRAFVLTAMMSTFLKLPRCIAHPMNVSYAVRRRPMNRMWCQIFCASEVCDGEIRLRYGDKVASLPNSYVL